jgi:hypothetical protein
MVNGKAPIAEIEILHRAANVACPFAASRAASVRFQHTERAID